VTEDAGLPPNSPPPQGPAYDLPPPPVSAIDDWQRLSKRNIALYPVLSIGNLAVPLVIAFFIGGRGEGRFFSGPWFSVVAVLAAVLFGIVPWLTTRYRITDTQLQVRRGLLNRKVLTAPLDRVRSVDLESGIVHRVLRLSKVSIGTGVDSSRIDLDALTTTQAAQLQSYLLARKQSPATGSTATAHPIGMPSLANADVDTGSPARGGQHQETELARINWSWLKFAPFSLASLVVVAVVGGFGGQFIGDISVDEQFSAVEGGWDWLAGQALVVLVLAGVVAVIVGWLLLSTLSYVLTWWNLRLTRSGDGTLRLVRGLFTTKTTTVEESKVRGVVMTQPALLRTVKGAELSTLSTGVGNGGTTQVLPPCPREVAISVGHSVLEEEGSLTQVLAQHGKWARRRCHVRAQWGTVFGVVASGVATYFFALPVWLPAAVFVGWAALAVALAEASYKHLGHGITDQHVMSGHGTLGVTREVLERSGVIGWVIRQSFFQRRRGLATLVATTAAGSESVQILDIPLPLAMSLAREATPEAFESFV